jgi:DNA topoisomerase-1
LLKFRIFLDYNFTAKVEQDFDEIAEEVWSKMMQNSTINFTKCKDVEANAERESGENLGNRS